MTVAEEAAAAVESPVRPLGDRMLVLPDSQEKVTEGGVVIPDSITERSKIGTVLAVGNGMLNMDGTRTPLETQVGERVIFTEYGGVDVKLAGTKYVVLRESDVLGVLAEEARDGA